MRSVKIVSASSISTCIGAYLGITYERWKSNFYEKETRSENRSINNLHVNRDLDLASESTDILDILPKINNLSPKYYIPVVEASSKINTNAPSLSSRTDLLFPNSQHKGQSIVERANEIMKHGYARTDQLKYYDNYVLSYDRRRRTANWVFEHLRPDDLDRNKKVSDRSNSVFSEEQSVHPFFRSTNEDYKNSGYDRGHLAAAGNHRHSQKAMDETFFLCNIAPQVGKGFNRDIWNDLEKYVRSVGRKNKNVYVCTGPLYLPRAEPDGRTYVKYEVIGRNHVAVPTHFFKVLLIENHSGEFELQSFVMPNQVIPNATPLKNYLVPLENIERAAGFILFDRTLKSKLKTVNGRRS